MGTTEDMFMLQEMQKMQRDAARQHRHHGSIHVVGFILVFIMTLAIVLVVTSSSGSSNASASLSAPCNASGGIFKAFATEMEKLGDDIKKEVESVGNDIAGGAKDVAHYANPGNWL